MKKLFVGVFVVFAILGGYSVWHKQKPTGDTPTAQKSPLSLEQKLALVPYPPDADLTASPRDPASSELNADQKDYFQIYEQKYSAIALYLMKKAQDKTQEDSQKILGRYLDQMSKIFYRTDVKVKEFDKVLGSEASSKKFGPPMTERPLYKGDLIPLWVLREKVRNQIAHVLKDLLVYETDPAFKDEQLAAVKAILDYTRGIWTMIADDSANGDYKIANRVTRLVLQDLFEEIDQIISDFSERYYTKSGHPVPSNFNEFQALLNRMIFKDEQERQTVLMQVQRDFDKLVDQEDQIEKNEVRQKKLSWITIAKKDIMKALEEDQTNKRDPQSTGICPSGSESMGNITGSGFPKGTWALTLDDGPHVKHTDTIFQAFTQNGLRGTFFWLAQLTSRSGNRPVIDNIISEGHTVASHSFSHANLPTLGSSALSKEIVEANSIHTQAFGFKPKFFRCPYGACGKPGSNIRQMIADQGMVHVFWNVDSLDWKDKNADLLMDRVSKQVMAIDAKGSGGIVLFHDIHETSAATMVQLTRWMKNKGYRVVTMAEIAEEVNNGRTCANGWTPQN